MMNFDIIDKAQWAENAAIRVKNKKTIQIEDVHALAEAVRILAQSVKELAEQ